MPGPKKKRCVIVKASECKREYVDYPLEMFACLDAQLRFGNLMLPPPTLGVFMLWELSSCEFFKHPETCSIEELGRALYIDRARRAAIPAVERYVYADNPRLLDHGARDCLVAGGPDLIDNLPRVRAYLHALPWNGFRMIPEGDPMDPSPFLFEGFRCGVTAAMAAKFGLPVDRVLWEIPVTLLGLMAAGEAWRQKVDGVGRPYDREDVKRKLAEARAKAEAEAELEADREAAAPSDPSDPSDKSEV